MNLKYCFGALLTLPLLPLMYYQGKKIKANIPRLPEASGPRGSSHADSSTGRSLQMLALGESTIAGVGVGTHEEGFTGTLAQELTTVTQMSIDWKVYARSGYTASRVTQRMLPEISEKSIDLIIIGLGGNDAFALNSPWKWRLDIKELIENLYSKFPGASIVFCNMPPIKEFPAFTPLIKFTIGNLVEIYGEVLQDLIEKFENVYYFGEIITLQNWIVKLQIEAEVSDFFSDGVHPSKLTYQTWAKDIGLRISQHKRLRDALLERLQKPIDLVVSTTTHNLQVRLNSLL